MRGKRLRQFGTDVTVKIAVTDLQMVAHRSDGSTQALDLIFPGFPVGKKNLIGLDGIKSCQQ